MKESDVYRWYYKNDLEYRQKNFSTAYWCCDNQCVVIDGELRDTYWGGVNKSFVGYDDKVISVEDVDLEFVCNLNDIRFISEYEKEDYDCVFDLSHQKGSYKVYAVDKDAQISNKALLVKWQSKLEKAQYEKKSAEWDIERANEEISKLNGITSNE